MPEPFFDFSWFTLNLMVPVGLLALAVLGTIGYLRLRLEVKELRQHVHELRDDAGVVVHTDPTLPDPSATFTEAS